MNTEYTLTAAGKSFKLNENQSPRGLRNGLHRPDELWIYCDQGFNRKELSNHIIYLQKLLQTMENPMEREWVPGKIDPEISDVQVCPVGESIDPDIIQQPDGTVDAIAQDLENEISNATVRDWDVIKGH